MFDTSRASRQYDTRGLSYQLDNSTDVGNVEKRCLLLRAPNIGGGIDVGNIDVETRGLGGLDSLLSPGQSPRFV